MTLGYIESGDLSILTFKNTLDISVKVPSDKLRYVMSQCHFRDIRDQDTHELRAFTRGTTNKTVSEY